MSSPPNGWAGFGALKEAQQRRRETEVSRATEPQQVQESEATTLSPAERVAPAETVSKYETVAPAETLTPAETLSPRATLSKKGSQPFRNERVAPAETLSPRERVSAGVRVDFKAGYCEIPNYVLDNLYPLLDPIEQVVYQRLFRLSHGFGRDSCEVSLGKLTETTKVKKTRLIVALRQLETMGLVVREASILGGSRADRGNRYRILLPEVTLPPGERVARGERVSGDATLSPRGNMKKNIKEIHERVLSNEKNQKEELDPVYEIRTIAVRLYESLRKDEAYSPDQLRAAVQTVLMGQGQSVDDETIDRAIKGMV